MWKRFTAENKVIFLGCAFVVFNEREGRFPSSGIEKLLLKTKNTTKVGTTDQLSVTLRLYALSKKDFTLRLCVLCGNFPVFSASFFFILNAKYANRAKKIY